MLPNNNILHEPKGVCALITPWNWPMNQTCLKVIPAIAAGCTMVLKTFRDCTIIINDIS
jgi:aldehyde dehydrogenase (NAD+)